MSVICRIDMAKTYNKDNAGNLIPKSTAVVVMSPDGRSHSMTWETLAEARRDNRIELEFYPQQLYKCVHREKDEKSGQYVGYGLVRKDGEKLALTAEQLRRSMFYCIIEVVNITLSVENQGKTKRIMMLDSDKVYRTIESKHAEEAPKAEIKAEIKPLEVPEFKYKFPVMPMMIGCLIHDMFGDNLTGLDVFVVNDREKAAKIRANGVADWTNHLNKQIGLSAVKAGNKVYIVTTHPEADMTVTTETPVKPNDSSMFGRFPWGNYGEYSCINKDGIGVYGCRYDSGSSEAFLEGGDWAGSMYYAMTTCEKFKYLLAINTKQTRLEMGETNHGDYAGWFGDYTEEEYEERIKHCWNSLVLDSLNWSKVNEINYFFAGAAIRNIVIANSDGDSIRSARGTFAQSPGKHGNGIIKNRTIDISTFKLPNLEVTTLMFAGNQDCKIKLGDLRLDKVRLAGCMFNEGCNINELTDSELKNYIRSLGWKGYNEELLKERGTDNIDDCVANKFVPLPIATVANTYRKAKENDSLFIPGSDIKSRVFSIANKHWPYSAGRTFREVLGKYIK